MSRTSPVSDTVTTFVTSMDAITYQPELVNITNSYPSNPLKSLLNLACQFTSSIDGDVSSSSVLSTGWLTGYRSVSWYKSVSTYLQISFGDLARITSISLKQLPNSPTYTLFNNFRLSFSNDGLSYAFLPEVFRKYFFRFSLLSFIVTFFLRLQQLQPLMILSIITYRTIT